MPLDLLHADGRDAQADAPPDPDIAPAVVCLQRAGVQTFESCQGGPGHLFPVPTVRFWGDHTEGLRALAVALHYGLPAEHLRRAWNVGPGGELIGPFWEITFRPSH